MDNYSYLTAIMSDGVIYSYNAISGQKFQIGVTMDTFKATEDLAKEATEKAEKYYKRLVELGDIVPPKTPEELIKELTEQVIFLSKKVETLSNDKVSKEKENGSSSDTKSNGIEG